MGWQITISYLNDALYGHFTIHIFIICNKRMIAKMSFHQSHFSQGPHEKRFQLSIPPSPLKKKHSLIFSRICTLQIRLEPAATMAWGQSNRQFNVASTQLCRTTFAPTENRRKSGLSMPMSTQLDMVPIKLTKNRRRRSSPRTLLTMNFCIP
jgi:hypothetical protein